MYIYKITNLINNKVYVGLDSRDIKLKSRWKEHVLAAKHSNNKKVLYRAMRKYGISNFVFEIIEELDSIEDLQKRERYWISELETTNSKFGYNRTTGGETFAWDCMTNEEVAISKQKMIAARKKIWDNLSDEDREYKINQRRNGLLKWWNENLKSGRTERTRRKQAYWDSQSQETKKNTGKRLNDAFKQWFASLSKQEKINLESKRLLRLREWRQNLSVEEAQKYFDLTTGKLIDWYENLSELDKVEFQKHKKNAFFEWWNSITIEEKQQNHKKMMDGWNSWWSGLSDTSRTEIIQKRLKNSLKTRLKRSKPKVLKQTRIKQIKIPKEKETLDGRKARLMKASMASGIVNSKTYEVESPTGENFKIKNLNEFCKLHNLDRPNMQSVCDGKQSQHRGWKCWYVDDLGNKIQPIRKTLWKRETVWTARDANGNIFIIVNLKEFCRLNNLSYSSMLKVAKRQRNEHSGWTIVEGSYDNESDFQESYGINRSSLRKIGRRYGGSTR